MLRCLLLIILVMLVFQACLNDSPKDPVLVGANYLNPVPNVCTEFTLYDFVNGKKERRQHYQVFFRKKNDSVVSIEEVVYGRVLERNNFIGTRSLEVNVNRKTETNDSLEIHSDLYGDFKNRYRNLDEVLKLAKENVTLKELVPETNARKVGYLAPFHYGVFSLDTAYISINGDLDNQEWAYTMIFRKNGELILSYRFHLSGKGKGEVVWIAEETRTQCDSILFQPDT